MTGRKCTKERNGRWGKAYGDENDAGKWVRIGHWK